MSWIVKLVGLLALCASAGGSLGASGTGRDEIIAYPEVAGPSRSETGMWRTKTQQVFDPAERLLVRRLYTIWDPHPSRNLDFVWVPDSFADDREGLVSGQGRLIWRIKGQAAYDPSSIFAEFRGTMEGGRPEGRGTYVEQNGLAYEGDWNNGAMEGRGQLRLPNGDEYIGQFRSGKANGAGRYIDVAGEIFEGQFVDGLREGTGTTTLPSGAVYRSTWNSGHESEGSRSVRLTQLGDHPPPGGVDGVRMSVRIGHQRGVPEGGLQYTASTVGSGFLIRPANKRLMDLWKGSAEIQLLPQEEGQGSVGPLAAVREEAYPPTVVVEVQNQSTAPLQLAGAYLDVQSSVSDLQPAIQLTVGLFGDCSWEPLFRPVFKLENFGWSAAERATLRFAFGNAASRARPPVLNLSRNLGRIDKAVTVDLEADLRAAGVDTSGLKARAGSSHDAKAGLSCGTRDPASCADVLKSSPMFGSLGQHVVLEDTNLVLGAIGTLEYMWTDAKGTQRKGTSPFVARLLLGHLVREPETACAEGGLPEAIAVKPQNFLLDRSDYRISMNFPPRLVPPGRTSGLSFQVQAAKSSQHDFRIVVQLADGREISSRPITLQYYVPSWFRGEEQ